MDEKANEALLGRDMFGDKIKPDIKGILKNKFLIPPFSVLSARDGDWQNRKRQWIALGIQSELGRGGDEASASFKNQDKPTNFQKTVGKRGLARCFGQDLMKGENPNFRHEGKGYSFAESQNTNLDEKTQKALGCYASGFGSAIERNTGGSVGTSIFDPVLCELMYGWFCPEGGVIIDPLCGGSVRGIVATVMGYHYWGCDLSGKQIDANIEQGNKICPDAVIRWVKGDALEQLPLAPGADFIFTCPPYGDLEVYSDDPADISTMPYSAFLEALWKIIALACIRLKRDRFACIVVGDFRDKQGFLHNFVSDTADAFLATGLKLYNEIILVTAVGSLPIRITKQFEAGRKIGKTHQNVLVFKKV